MSARSSSGLAMGLTTILITLSIQLISCGVDYGMNVELDVFSGRENPSWNLDSQETADFIEKFSSLSRITAEVSAWEGLGYRGIIVRGPLAESQNPAEIRVYNGTVRAKIEDKTLNYADPKGALELWLIETSKGKIEEDLYQSFRNSIIEMNDAESCT